MIKDYNIPKALYIPHGFATDLLVITASQRSDDSDNIPDGWVGIGMRASSAGRSEG